MHDNLRKTLGRRKSGVAAPARRVSIVMPTVSWTGTFEPCARRVLELIDARPGDVEFVVVLDGEAAPPPAWLVREDVTIVSTGVRSGPAVARNRAAVAARGEILLFVDADVELDEAAVDVVRSRFDGDAGLSALFGTYDDEPAAPGTASQFRNLLHHHTHVVHPGPATTFWAGCGAIRAVAFRAVGGFDGQYRSPCIEDIELGTRLAARGHRIELDPALRCKHLKRWTVRSMVYTDIVHRAVPWTRVMLRNRHVPACLAIDWRNRASGALALAGAAAIVPAILFPWAWIAVAACLLATFLLNLPFYRLCFRKRGAGFAIASVGLHGMFFLYSTLTFAAVVVYSLVRPTSPVEGPAELPDPSAAGTRPLEAVP